MKASPSKEDQALIEAYVNETISPEEFAQFEARLKEDADLRAELRHYLVLDSDLREAMTMDETGAGWTEADTAQPESAPSKSFWGPMVAVAAIAFVSGIAAMTWMANQKPPEQTVKTIDPAPKAEAQASGFAFVHQLRTDDATPTTHKEGDTLSQGMFALSSGAAELHFFCGARIIVEAPAQLEIKSAWEAVCHDGNLRIEVPPAARGFKVTTPGSEIIDLGTEFGLQVRDGNTTVEVLDGEIAVKHGAEKEQLLTSGQSRYLPKGGASETPKQKRVNVPNRDSLGGQFDAQRKASFQRWQEHSQKLAQDQRLIAYYDFQGKNELGIVPNRANSGDTELRGAVIMAEPVAGRWPSTKRAMEFKRPGSRIRVHAAGEFSAFTFATWVRIDSLSHRYNALFMADSYETGEPHWQIREDGSLMLSVMVDDSDRKLVNTTRKTGRHLIYFSPPIWDETKSGEWIHLTSVYDPSNRQVSHYANGEQISNEPIHDNFFIDSLRIGNAEIGNWGQPFRRNEPAFAIRNLNGRIDELAVFNAALSADEVKALYTRSKH